MKAIKIKPRGKQVLVQVDPEQSRKSDSGIVTPDNVEQERKAIGKVIALGTDVKDLKVGDKVIYGAFAGEKLKINDNIDYVLLFDEDTLATLE